MANKQVIFKFDSTGAANKKAINDITRLFATAGAQVVSHDVATTTSKRAGIDFRAVNFTFADSQTVTLNVKATGDVFEAKVNGSVVPLKEQDDHAGTIKELAAQMTRRRAAFQKSLARVKTPTPAGVRQSRAQKLTAKQAERDGLQTKVNEAKTELSELTGTPVEQL